MAKLPTKIEQKHACQNHNKHIKESGPQANTFSTGPTYTGY